MSLNVTNRVIVTVLAGLLAVATVGAGLALFGLWFPDPAVFGSFVATGVSNLADLNGADAFWVAVVLIGLFVVSAFVVGLELRPARTRPFLVSESELGDVVIERRTVVEFIEFVGRQVPGVYAIGARVTLRESGDLAIRCHVTADAKSVLDQLADAIRTDVVDKVEGQLGLGVERVDTRFRITTRRPRSTVR